MSCQKTNEIDLGTFLLEREESQWSEFREHYPGCADCSREVALWSNLERALGSSSPGKAHPSEEELLALTTLSLERGTQLQVEDHLAGCAACRSEVATLRSFDFSAVMSEQHQTSAVSASDSSLLSRIQAGLGEFFESITAGGALQPALVTAALMLLLIPVGLRVFQGSEGVAPESPGSTPMAQREAPSSSLSSTPEQLAQRDENVTSDSIPTPEIVRAEVATQVAVGEPSATAGPLKEIGQGASVLAQVENEIPVSDDDSLPEWATDVAAETVLVAALLPNDLPLYGVAGISGLGGSSVRMGGFVRSLGGRTTGLRVLSPDHVGWTSSASPTLYWELSEATELPIEVVVGNDEELTPSLEVRLAGPHAAGLHKISLAEAGVKLDPNRIYRWSASLVVDEERRSRDVVAGSAIKYRPAPDSEAAEFADAPAGHLAHRFAARGYWYDAFGQLTLWLEEEPQDARLLDHRRALLEQVGLASLSTTSE